MKLILPKFFYVLVPNGKSLSTLNPRIRLNSFPRHDCLEKNFKTAATICVNAVELLELLLLELLEEPEFCQFYALAHSLLMKRNCEFLHTSSGQDFNMSHI